MIIKQLSIFIENRTGGLNEVALILSKNGINMRAFSVADGTEFGILRVIVSDVELATNVLREANFKVGITDVISISCPNTPGALSAVLELLAQEEVFIEYMYAFSDGDVASTIIRPTDIQKCRAALESERGSFLKLNQLYTF